MEVGDDDYDEIPGVVDAKLRDPSCLGIAIGGPAGAVKSARDQVKELEIAGD